MPLYFGYVSAYCSQSSCLGNQSLDMPIWFRGWITIPSNEQCIWRCGTIFQSQRWPPLVKNWLVISSADASYLKLQQYKWWRCHLLSPSEYHCLSETVDAPSKPALLRERELRAQNQMKVRIAEEAKVLLKHPWIVTQPFPDQNMFVSGLSMAKFACLKILTAVQTFRIDIKHYILFLSGTGNWVTGW